MTAGLGNEFSAVTPLETAAMAKKALITGITGQDGAYLAELLLKKGYKVYGMRRRSSVDNASRLREYLGEGFKNPRLKLVNGDMTDSASVTRLIGAIRPAEIYNLAAQSHVAVSFEQPEYTANCDALGTLRILEAVKTLGLIKKTKSYQASTSELYGKVSEVPQDENTPFHPQSPYGIAKLYAYWITVNYRESYGLFASNGILFNQSRPCAARSSPPGKRPSRWQGSCSAWKSAFTWAI